jgi:hypothetical protein
MDLRLLDRPGFRRWKPPELQLGLSHVRTYRMALMTNTTLLLLKWTRKVAFDFVGVVAGGLV